MTVEVTGAGRLADVFGEKFRARLAKLETENDRITNENKRLSVELVDKNYALADLHDRLQDEAAKSRELANEVANWKDNVNDLRKRRALAESRLAMVKMDLESDNAIGARRRLGLLANPLAVWSGSMRNPEQLHLHGAPIHGWRASNHVPGDTRVFAVIYGVLPEEQ